jgi:hypothetical protein
MRIGGFVQLKRLTRIHTPRSAKHPLLHVRPHFPATSSSNAGTRPLLILLTTCIIPRAGFRPYHCYAPSGASLCACLCACALLGGRECKYITFPVSRRPPPALVTFSLLYSFSPLSLSLSLSLTLPLSIPFIPYFVFS